MVKLLETSQVIVFFYYMIELLRLFQKGSFVLSTEHENQNVVTIGTLLDLFITIRIICETEIREINTSLAIQCMQECTQGCYKTINTDFKRNNTPFVLNISQRSSEERISLFGF